MFERLIQVTERYEDISRQLADPAVLNDHQQYQKLAKQHRDLGILVEAYREYKRIEQGIHDSKAMLQEQDADLRQMATDELEQLQALLASGGRKAESAAAAQRPQ